MQTFSILIDPVSISSKPTSEEAGYLSRRLRPSKVTITELQEKILSGHSFCPAATKNGTRAKNDMWVSQQIFALDFDSDYSFTEFISKSHEINILPTFCYTTLSYDPITKPNKFRSVYVVDELIENDALRQNIQNCLLNIFQKADRAPADNKRIFYPGRHLLYSQLETTISINDIINTSANANSETLCNPILLHKGNADKELCFCDDQNCQNVLRDRIPFDTFSHIPQGGRKIEWLINASSGRWKIDLSQNAKRSELLNSCQLVRYLSEKNYIGYSTRLHLIYNLFFTKGGIALLSDLLDKMKNWTPSRQQIFTNIIRDIKRSHKENRPNCHPSACNSNRCQFFHECKNEGSILSLLNKSTYQVEEDTTDYRPLEEVREKFNEVFQKAVKDTTPNKLTIIKCDPGVGKTHAIFTDINLEDISVAVPTHRLISEIEDKYENAVYMQRWNDFNELTNNKTFRKIKNLGLSALFDKASDYFTEEELETLESAFDKLKFKKLNEQQIKEASSVLLTHEKCLRTKLSSPTIIFDEDPLNCMNSTTTFSIALLKKMRNAAETSEDLKNRLDNILSSTKTISALEKSTVKVKKEIYEYLINNLEWLQETDNLMVLSKKISFYSDDKEITIMEHRNLPENKRIIILSATINEDIIRELIKDTNYSVEFITLPKVQYVGQLIQHPKHSFSRESIARRRDDFLEAIEDHKETNIITFKKEAEYLKQNGFNVKATFGATEGLDTLSGSDLVVAGTPHNNPIAYLLVASRCGMEIPSMPEFTRKRVVHNGKSHMFPCFAENEFLNVVQRHFIEEELYQAIGRARLANNPNTVHLFSNFPMAQAQIAN